MNVYNFNGSGVDVYDCVGIGFGPSNIALAVALEERGLLQNCLFLEAQSDFLWHPGMLIEGTDIQHNPLRDFVTPRNPQSPYGFLSYLKAEDRLFDYLNLAASYPPRRDYARYIKWVASHFDDYVSLNTCVTSIDFAKGGDLIEIQTRGDGPRRILAKSIVFATGRSAYIPEEFQHAMSDDIVHMTHYLPAKKRWLKRHNRPSICVLGGSQSAIEILLDLSKSADVTSISRSFGFKQKDLSAFTESIYYPEFVEYFHNAGAKAQNAMTAELWRSNYGAADPDVIAELNFRIYEDKVDGDAGLRLLSNARVRSIERQSSGEGYLLTVEEKYTGRVDEIAADGVVLATGYQNFGNRPGQEPYPALLKGIVSKGARFREDGGIDIGRDYRLLFADQDTKPAVFINGLCEASHGFGDAGSFSLLSVRSDEIARSIQDTLAVAKVDENEGVTV